MKIALMPNLSKQNAHTYTVRIIKRLLELQCEIFLYAKYRDYFDIQAIHFYEDFSDMVRECDAVITIGGDGTIIHAAKHAAAAAKPILGINLGRIGFVAGLEIDELDKLKYLISGDYKVENRMLLKVTVHTGAEEREIYALNDAVVSRGSLSRMVDLSVSYTGSKVTQYRADGLIVSTPTGSTAYSLSAGGPVIEPEMRCMVLTPICAHSLFSRSVIFGPDEKLSISASTRDGEGNAYLTVDGETSVLLRERDVIDILPAAHSVRLIKLKNKGFYEILNEKLSERIQQHNIDAQEELLKLLRAEGYDVTQATVSRDIKELRLVKTLANDGKYKYSTGKSESSDISLKFFSLFADSVLSVEFAGNMVALKCMTGMAQAVCAAMDSMQWDGVVATLAGDDTIFILVRNEAAAINLVTELKKIMKS